MQMTTDSLCLHWLKGKSRRVAFTSDFSLCKYLMYPSGTKGSKYTLESGGEVHDRSEGCHRSSWTVLRPHCMAQCRRGKIQTSNQRTRGSRHPIPAAPHLPEPGTSCVWSCQVLHHLEWCLLFSLLRSLKSPDINMAICSVVRGGI